MANYIYQDEKFSLSRTRRARLLNQLAVVCIIVTGIHAFVSHYLQLGTSKDVFISIFMASLFSLLLNRIGLFKAAAIVGLIVFNIFIFLIAASEVYESGIHIHLVSAGFASVILFGHEDRLLGSLFAFFSMILYLCSVLSNFSMWEYRIFTEDQSKLLFIINTLVFLGVSLSLLLFMLKLNSKAESNLRTTSQKIEIQNEQLVKANLELDRFVYSASHDLRAPLSSISGLVTLAQRDPSAQHLYAGMMRDRIRVMNRFITDIVNYARNARLEIEIAEVNLSQLVREIIDGLKYFPNYERITIELKADSELILLSDHSRLRVVFNNLITNAIKYQDSRKEHSYLRIHLSLTGTTCQAVLADNGIGIKEEFQARIFDMFYRATEKSKGSGLGLYIVKETLDKLNGSISFQSTFGKGTTFTVSIPT